MVVSTYKSEVLLKPSVAQLTTGLSYLLWVDTGIRYQLKVSWFAYWELSRVRLLGT